MLIRIKQIVGYGIRAIKTRERFPSIFSDQLPSSQKAVDLFKGDWASKIPLENVVSGPREDLFCDPRIQWFIDHVNSTSGLQGKYGLELGPLEGGHTAMLEKAGAEEILGIESNGRAYLKCLVVKELLGLQKAKFVFGDFVKYLQEPGKTFDFAIACGVFYHLRDPHLVFQSLRQRVNGPMFLWTHYWSKGMKESHPDTWLRFSSTRTGDVAGGKKVQLHRHEYGGSVFSGGFFGGNARYSEWLDEDGLRQAIDSAGWKIVKEMDASNSSGPAISAILEPK
ncbi:MAG TPA: class I SAM-dependent methyltransferase [Fibrobacteria bacterium]|nr:class I SAM-dependent methyltransferase [Fibrobacteria bacterium]